MDAKTPVTLLQEYLIKLGYAPTYKVIYMGGESHDPVFHLEVEANGWNAVGKGKSKKEAKHNAASLLLLELNGKEVWRNEVPIVSPYSSDLKENAIGALQEFCVQHNMALPKYEIIRDEGMPHAKIFGVRCTVSSFFFEAEDRTKKQAKQKVSHQMLLKLKEYFQEKIAKDVKKPDNLIVNACQETKKAFELLCQDRMMNNETPYYSNTVCSGMFNITDHFLKNVLPLSETLRSLANVDDTFLREHKNPEELLKAIMNELNYSYNFTPLRSKSPKDFLCNLQIKQIYDANFIGLDKSPTKARWNAVIKALDFMIIMSKSLY